MTCVRAGLIGLLCATLIFGQGPKDRPTPNSDSSQSQIYTQTPPPLRVDVDLVLVQATVSDSANRYVTGLRPEDFQVWEDKIEQRVEYFSSENVPVSVGIVFDISGSMKGKLASARAAANTFLRMGDRGDEYFLILFSDSPQVVQEFTTDITRLLSPLLFAQAKGNTSLYDALYLGLEKVNRGSNPRKAVLLITDGSDNHSRYSLSNVEDFAKEHDVMIYSIGIVNEMDMQFSGSNGRAVLQNLAHLTGGISFFPSSVDRLDAICQQIGIDLKNQYVLGYRPSNFSNNGSWRKIRVAVNKPKGTPRLHVRAKSGYYSWPSVSAPNTRLETRK
jgi:Ca-activated chloride channel homolog